MKNVLLTFLFASLWQGVLAQNPRITIQINDERGKPLSDVYLELLGINSWGISDSIGVWDPELPPGQYLLRTSHIAFKESTTPFTISDQSPPGNQVVIQLTREDILFTEVTVLGTSASRDCPVTYINIKGKTLNEINYGQDMPYLLQFTPSAVSTSDAGNGVGYTGIRIRGNDATRINVTLNGIPYNDAESQQVYWVNLPDMASSVDEVQIQRGVGTSVNGVSAMGASINLFTNDLSEKPGAIVSLNGGSYGLLRSSIQFESGRLDNLYFLEARLSKLVSDGYVDRASSDLTSFFLTGGFSAGNYQSIINVFGGSEQTYQAWAGIPKDSLETNRTYNPYTYENQTDNYNQTHVQWHHDIAIAENERLQISANYTKGKGYYEQLETGQLLSDYNIDDIHIGDTTIYYDDLITQKWLDNQMVGLLARYTNTLFDLEFITGGGYFYYTGKHFGKVLSGNYLSVADTARQFYYDTALKHDLNAFFQGKKSNETGWTYWFDVQLRMVAYSFTGKDSIGGDLPDEVILPFLNPKIGLQRNWNQNVTSYFSVAYSGREPNRDDYVQSTNGNRPSPEKLLDFELGHQIRSKGWEVQVNYYTMYYQDQLILTGEINEVGAYTRNNVPRSVRAGIELAWNKWLIPKLLWEANATYSINKIDVFENFVDNYPFFEQTVETYHQVDIAFSPSIIASNSLQYTILDKRDPRTTTGIRCYTDLNTKYVSRQYIDNTQNVSRSLEPYLVNDLRLVLSYQTLSGSIFSWNFTINNVFNEQYEANAWVYRYFSDGVESTIDGYYPQAERHFVTGIKYHF